jgi:hypothetical protein
MLRAVDSSIRGAHAPRVLGMVPSPSQTFAGIKKKRFGEAPKWAREGACAPQTVAALSERRISRFFVSRKDGLCPLCPVPEFWDDTSLRQGYG